MAVLYLFGFFSLSVIKKESTMVNERKSGSERVYLALNPERFGTIGKCGSGINLLCARSGYM